MRVRRLVLAISVIALAAFTDELWLPAVAGLALAILLEVLARLSRAARLARLIVPQPRAHAELRPGQVGVKPSPIAEELYGDDAPYIERRALDAELDEVIVSHRFVVVTGVPDAGKSRSLYEAIGRSTPDLEVLVVRDRRTGRDPLAKLLRSRRLLAPGRPYVVVAQDLEERLAALDLVSLNRWFSVHPEARLLATMSADVWAAIMEGKLKPQFEKHAALLGNAKRVRCSRDFDDAAVEQARITYGLPEGDKRLGVYLAGAADFSTRFAALEGAARAIMLSAINIGRCGIARPIAVERVLSMARRVTRRDGQPFSDKAWDQGMAACTETVEGSPALLSANDDGTVVVSATLIELADSRSFGSDGLSALPLHVFQAVIEEVAESGDDRLAIATAAALRGQPDLAIELLQSLKEDNQGFASEAAGSALTPLERGDEPSEVRELLDYVSDQGPPPASPEPRELPRATADELFDPTPPPRSRARAFYRRRELRDALRFIVLLLIDASAIAVGIYLAHQLDGWHFIKPADRRDAVTVTAVVTVLVLVFFLFFGLYRSERERARLSEIIKGTGLAAVSLALLALAGKYTVSDVSKIAVGAASAIVVAFGGRSTYDHVSRWWVGRSGLKSRTALVTDGDPHIVAKLIVNAHRRPLQMVGYLGDARPGAGWVGPLDQLPAAAHARELDRVIIADTQMTSDARLALVFRCHALGIATEVVPSPSELFQGLSDALDDPVVPLVDVRPLFLNYVGRTVKRGMDLVIGFPLCVVAVLLFGPLVGFLKLRSGGARVLVREYRPGLGAVSFGMWRLRTDRPGTSSSLGRFLHRLRVNEVPQLINVLNGTMSLVGPRPLSSEEFGELDALRRGRYAVLPGITGLWQIARRGISSVDDVANLDIIYCRRWTPLLDLTILLRTIPAVLTPPPTIVDSAAPGASAGMI